MAHEKPISRFGFFRRQHQIRGWRQKSEFDGFVVGLRACVPIRQNLRDNSSFVASSRRKLTKRAHDGDVDLHGHVWSAKTLDNIAHALFRVKT